MPLLSPTQLSPQSIQQVLKEARTFAGGKSDEKSELSELLEESGLGVQDTLNTIGELMRGADTSAVRVRAAETSLKLNRLLADDDIKGQTIVNIIIKDSQFDGLNPILLPR